MPDKFKQHQMATLSLLGYIVPTSPVFWPLVCWHPCQNRRCPSSWRPPPFFIVSYLLPSTPHTDTFLKHGYACLIIAHVCWTLTHTHLRGNSFFILIRSQKNVTHGSWSQQLSIAFSLRPKDDADTFRFYTKFDRCTPVRQPDKK